MRLPRGVVAFLSLSFVASYALDSAAYCRTRSCEFGEKNRAEKCERDASGCVTEGDFTYWPDPCLTYAIQVDGSPRLGLDADQVQMLVQTAFENWQNAECPGGGHPNFGVVFQGYVGCHEQQAVCAGAASNVHTVMFKDSGWDADDTNATGLTTPLGSTSSGFLIDADIEFNSDYFEASGTVSSPFDLKRVIAHEVGHFLGLGHTDRDGSLMSTYYHLISEEGTLTADDIEGICAIYPPVEASMSCSASSPAYDECSANAIGPDNPCTLPSSAGNRPGTGGGCAYTERHAPPSSASWIATLGVVGALARRRARR